jgi:hypothetical protein
MRCAHGYLGLLALGWVLGFTAEAPAEQRVQEARAHGYRYRWRGRARPAPAPDPPPPIDERAPDPPDLEFVISGERLAGAYAFSEVVTDEPDTRVESSGGVVNLLTGSSVSAGGFIPFAMPRLGFDLVARGLTVGVCAGYSSSAGDLRRESGSMSRDEDLGNLGIWLVNPRIGYLHRFTPIVGLWPRVGMTFVWLNAETPGVADVSSQLTDVTLEMPLVLRPVKHAAILVGPTFDIGSHGSAEVSTPTGTAETYRTLSNYGAMAGLALVF